MGGATLAALVDAVQGDNALQQLDLRAFLQDEDEAANDGAENALRAAALARPLYAPRLQLLLPCRWSDKRATSIQALHNVAAGVE